MIRLRGKIPVDDELDIVKMDRKEVTETVTVTSIPIRLVARFMECAVEGGFNKREFVMLAMMFAIRKMGKKVPTFKERAKVNAIYKHIIRKVEQ